jgi:methenyltetrahydromethanopterin cyclohydrolase
VQTLSVSRRSAPIVLSLVEDAAALGVAVTRGEAGEAVLDLSLAGLEAGRRLGQIRLGGLGNVALTPDSGIAAWPWSVSVRSAAPVIACLGSQYGGWTMSEAESSFSRLVRAPRAPSPARRRSSPISATATGTTSPLSSSRAIGRFRLSARKVAEDCGIDIAGLTVLFAPTGSLAGSVQIAARVLEVALHKAHALHFPLDRNRRQARRSGPLPPPVPDFMAAMGRTNDAIIYGGRVQLFVRGADDDARASARAAAEFGLVRYGKPFAEIFAAAGGDFYAIDALLFSPAEVVVSNLDTGQSFHVVLGARHHRRELRVSGDAPRIALFTDGGDWHRTQLLKAFRVRGAEVVTTSLASCALATKSPSGIVIPGFPDRLPDAALVRSVSAGGFEQITLRLGVLHGLAACGVPVWNEARAIERCVDKAMTSFLLAKAGIPTPATVATEDAALASDLVGGPGAQVLKPSSRAAAFAASRPARVCRQARRSAAFFICRSSSLQRGRATRTRAFWFRRGRVVGTMLRRSDTWITNIHQRGSPVTADPDDAMARLAVQAAAAVVAASPAWTSSANSVDRALALEVNSMPAWRGLQEVCDVNIASVLADDVLAGDQDAMSVLSLARSRRLSGTPVATNRPR